LTNKNLEKCIHCDQLILRKISKFGATRCHILRLKCTSFDFRWGSAPDLLAVLLRVEEEKSQGKGRGERGEGLRVRRGKVRKGVRK